MIVFKLQWQSWIVLTEVIWTKKPKFIIFFRESWLFPNLRLDSKLIMLITAHFAHGWFRDGLEISFWLFSARTSHFLSALGWCGWAVGSLLGFSGRFQYRMCRCPSLLAFRCCNMRTSYANCKSLCDHKEEAKNITQKSNEKLVISSYSFSKPQNQLFLDLVYETTMDPNCLVIAGWLCQRQLLPVLLAPKSMDPVQGNKVGTPLPQLR